MDPNKFSEEDKQRVIDFLNQVAKKAKLELTIPELIKFYGDLSFMQNTLLKKIDANILEVQEIIERDEDPELKEGE